MKTAVEWLHEQFCETPRMDFNNMLEQAKEMEKQQLEKTAIHFYNYGYECIKSIKEINGEKEFEQYYNETFKTK